MIAFLVLLAMSVGLYDYGNPVVFATMISVALLLIVTRRVMESPACIQCGGQLRHRRGCPEGRR